MGGWSNGTDIDCNNKDIGTPVINGASSTEWDPLPDGTNPLGNQVYKTTGITKNAKWMSNIDFSTPLVKDAWGGDTG